MWIDDCFCLCFINLKERERKKEKTELTVYLKPDSHRRRTRINSIFSKYHQAKQIPAKSIVISCWLCYFCFTMSNSFIIIRLCENRYYCIWSTAGCNTATFRRYLIYPTQYKVFFQDHSVHLSTMDHGNCSKF